MGTSLLVVLLGMLVPVLAAAPFYVAQSRREQAEDREYAERLQQQAAPADCALPEQRTESDLPDLSGESARPVEPVAFGARSDAGSRAPERAGAPAN